VKVEHCALGNDRWRAGFIVTELGRYEYEVTAWVDAFLSWRHDFVRRNTADEVDVARALQTGAALVEDAVKRAPASGAKRLREIARALAANGKLSVRRELALGDELALLMQANPDRRAATTLEPPLGNVASSLAILPGSAMI